jgi:hypothetical protein
LSSKLSIGIGLGWGDWTWSSLDCEHWRSTCSVLRGSNGVIIGMALFSLTKKKGKRTEEY